MIKKEIRERILSLLGDDAVELGDDESLVLSGRLSSMKVVELATWLEEKYNVTFYAHTFHVRDFDSINSILRLIKANQS